MKSIGIIPARYASTRFPGKPLTLISGKSMIERVYERCSSSTLLDRVVVATDDQRIYDHVISFGGQVVMTPECESGTERCLAALDLMQDPYDILINIQGDEPLIDASEIDRLISHLYHQTDCIATLIRPIEDLEELENPNVVKCIRAANGQALYFSRAPIPFIRDLKASDPISTHQFWAHIGLYGFHTEILRKIGALPCSSLESAEKLEQLRWIENNFIIFAIATSYRSVSVDQASDVDRIEKLLRNGHCIPS